MIESSDIIAVANGLMCYLGHSTGEILNSELWVVDSEDMGVTDQKFKLASLVIPTREEGGLTTRLFAAMDEHNMVVVRDAPLWILPRASMLEERHVMYEFLETLLHYFLKEETQCLSIS